METSPGAAGTPADFDCLAGGGEMGERMRSLDWARTPLGPVEGWPQSLRTAVSICLNSKFPMVIWWGPELVLLYNDGWIPILGPAKHPRALGAPGREIWPEVWDVIEPMFDLVMTTGQATWSDDGLLPVNRYGYIEEAYFTWSYSPIRVESGGIGGVFTAVTETTRRVIGERRTRTLAELAARGVAARSAESACRTAAEALAANPHDLPFVLIYLVDDAGAEARLAGTVGVGEEGEISPASVELKGPSAGASPWPLAEAVASGQAVLVEGLAERFGQLPPGVWPDPPRSALVLPVALPGHASASVLLVAAISPRLALDEDYRTFLGLIGGQIGTAVSDATAYEAERRRAEALAELDHAKTAFFSNVSHEFRTPLTLMLGPLEDALADSELPASGRERIEVVQRNALRLLKLVNMLLDFSRIEAGRMQASYVPTDLATYTAELASVFRSAVERAGLRFVVDCPPLDEAVYVDREMWEKIVLNLLSNAFKFTFEGEIEVSLRQAGDRVELAVRDTGSGIPAEELPHLFERFHRVKGARGRSFEGSGIGLALVQELARLHGGAVRAESQLGRGTTFTVSVPTGAAHLPADRVGAARPRDSTGLRGEEYADEALRWLPEGGAGLRAAGPPGGEAAPEAEAPRTPSARILLADDNADMREYVRRLLSRDHEVVAVPDGAAALRAARERRFDLVLSDVMMPRLDGFELLAALRADERTRTLPVILLSARAGEESRVEGMQAGADDYLVKPFTARELLARVEAHLKLQLARREAEEAVRASEAKFSTAFGRSPLALTITSLDDGRLVEVNEGFVRLSGYTREEALGRTPEELGLWIDPQVRAERFARLRAGESVPNIEARFRVRSGEELIGVIGSAVVEINSRQCVLSSVTDITDRIRAEEALRESHARLRTAMDAGRLGAWDWDIARDKIAWTDRLYEFHGLEPGAFGGTVEEFARLVHPEDLPRVQRALEQALERLSPYELEFRTIRPSGEVRWLFTRAEVLADASGAPARMIGITQDVTARREMEEALKEAARRKDEFLAMLAHELRNPLAPIRNAAQVLKLVGAATDHQQWAREVIERQTQHLTRLVDDLLDVSRITRGKVALVREPLDLATIVHRAVETSRPLIDARRHRLTVALPPEPVSVVGDLTRLVQVVGNLLNNAAKYTDEGGHIRLAAAREGEEAVIRVRDDGMGLPQDLLPHVFDLFTQANRSLDRSQGGLGIGLTLVRQLVEMHGGRVEAKSDGPGRGSEFVVRLPAQAPTAAAVAPGAPDGRARAVSHGLKILVVEDNVDSAQMLSLMLELGGHEVRTAHDGPAALAAAESFLPQVVLCDIGLPGMNGYEVAARLRRRPELERTPLIALTGYGQEEARRRAGEAGFDHHIVKPVEPDALAALLESLRSAS